MRLKKILTLITVTFAFIQIQAQDIEQWRQKGYEAKQQGDTQTAIDYYAKILHTNPDDYDARLALARLYYQVEKYDKAEKLFLKIYQGDQTDVEALKGLGQVYLMTDKLDKSIAMFQKAIGYLPNEVSLYLLLAKAYSWDGKLQKAIDVYQKILKIDDTYSEAYQGIGKMYYWMEKPVTAIKYYQKAIALDPDELPIKKEYREIVDNMKYQLSAKFSSINESEENYNIDALIQKYGVSKRINNYLNVSAGFLLDYSNRTSSGGNISDTIRYFDNSFIKIGYLSQHHKIDIYAGYTFADSKLSSYGLAWRADYAIGNIDITNTLNGGYDYFYYWNKVGQTQAEDELKIKFRKFNLSLNAAYGVVDIKPILDVPNDRYEEDTNPHTGYGTSLSYQVLTMPKTTIGMSYSYLNFAYKSQYYYSPMGRHLYGPSLSIYYPTGNFYIYAKGAYNIGSEYYYEMIDNQLETNYIDVTNWSANIEAGYQLKQWEFSIGSSKFYNPFYQNFTASISVKYKL